LRRYPTRLRHEPIEELPIEELPIEGLAVEPPLVDNARLSARAGE
jgi:hypothetical protein